MRKRKSGDGAGRRVAIVLLVYALVAALLLPGVDLLARALALPPLLGRLVRWILVLGVPVAAALAWRYPELGRGGEHAPPRGPG